nr:LysR family transcriptional regulator [Aquibacillus saliphilus]
MIKVLHEEKRITKTAERLYISQPAITHRIKQIEKDYNIKIVVRGKKGIQFTPEGEYLVNYSTRMLEELKKMKEYFLKLDGHVQGTLRLGVSSNFARYNLSRLLKEFHDQYPDVSFNLRTGWSNEVMALLQNDEIHMGIIKGNYKWPDEKLLISQEPICIVSKNPINMKELPKLERINYKTNNDLKSSIDYWWESYYAVPPLISMEVDSTETCKELVKNGLGYAILPSSALTEENSLLSMPISIDGEVVIRNTWLMYRSSSIELPVVRTFKEYLQNN